LLCRLSEEEMFVTIRRYSPQNGSVNRASLDLLRRQIQCDVLPTVQQLPGFHAYYMVSVDDRELMTMAVFENSEGTTEYKRLADEYTLRNPLVFELGLPVVTEGQVLAASCAVESWPAVALWPAHPGGMLLSASER
jgi:hypothetical protein